MRARNRTPGGYLPLQRKKENARARRFCPQRAPVFVYCSADRGSRPSPERKSSVGQERQPWCEKRCRVCGEPAAASARELRGGLSVSALAAQPRLQRSGGESRRI